MAHPQQAEFFDSVRSEFPRYFSGAKVLEVGSLNINGSVRPMFTDCDYTGVDLQLGAGVDLACPGQLLAFPSGHFDTVVSAECFEHNPFWRETLANMLRMLRPGGLIVVSCATTRRKEHGTTRSEPESSPFTVQERWDYYRNLTAQDFEDALHLDGWLADRHAWVNHISRDLYFLGLKHGADSQRLGSALCDALDARYAMGASGKALRRGIKAKLLGDKLMRS